MEGPAPRRGINSLTPRLGWFVVAQGRGGGSATPNAGRDAGTCRSPPRRRSRVHMG